MQQAETRRSPFDYDYLLKYLTIRGRDIYGADFCIPDEDLTVVMQLLAYFLRDEATARRLGIHLNKGILLTGPAGCGKKALIQLMSLFSSGFRKPVNRSCRKVCWEFSSRGLETIDRYSTAAFSPVSERPLTYCFTDLGKEAMVDYFGVNCSIMPEILLLRHELYKQQHMITHVTTRLSLNQLAATYGGYFVNRVRPMFNLVCFDARSADKRKADD